MGENKENRFLYWVGIISKFVAIPAFAISLIGFILHSCEIDNLKRLNKQHLDPRLSLMVFNNDNGIVTMQVRNISILPAVEVYVRKNVYFCLKDAREILSVQTELPGWHIAELLPNVIKTEEINKIFIDNVLLNTGLSKKWRPDMTDTAEPVVEIYVEYYRASDMKKYSFRQMYFMQGAKLVWSEVVGAKDNSYYSNLFRLVSNYENKLKFPNIEDLGRYKEESK